MLHGLTRNSTTDHAKVGGVMQQALQIVGGKVGSRELIKIGIISTDKTTFLIVLRKRKSNGLWIF